jgi:hypothetical protein
MVDELEFRKLVEIALDALMQHLILLEEDEAAGFEVEGQGGLLNVIFEEPAGKVRDYARTRPSARSGFPPYPPASNSTGMMQPQPSSCPDRRASGGPG